MPIKVEINGNTASITLSGNIDYSTQDDFREKNNAVLAAENVKEIHVDLSAVKFLDSSGIRALLSIQKKAFVDKKTMTLFNCSSAVLEIFEMGGFDKMFTIR